LDAGANPLHKGRGFDTSGNYVSMSAREWAAHKGSVDVVALIDRHLTDKEL
jgi:hypothetical protein